ncbi:hypothetical protein ACE6H2_007716 [Prunus campanulata]
MKCMEVVRKFMKTFLILRSVIDLFYMGNVILLGISSRRSTSNNEASLIPTADKTIYLKEQKSVKRIHRLRNRVAFPIPQFFGFKPPEQGKPSLRF